MSKDFIHRGRSVSELKAHLVLCVKYRRNVMSREMLDSLEGIFRRTLEKWEARLIEFNGETDHIHILFQYTPQVDLSKLINNLKTVSSRLAQKEYSAVIEKQLWKGAFWSSSYFVASCGGVTVQELKKYVQNQNRPVQ
ncbi:IS200/IS605 family transposase [Lusitaniella coriacea]|uniref:IS200/IS605 family transposase n=1 Tax=Lusitaniella coriacea TaxID=1983105 RepID=UPI003CFB6149